MDFVKDVVENVWVQRFFWSLITIIISVFIYRLIARAYDRREQRKAKLMANKKGRTMVRMFKSIARYTLIVIDFLIILQIFGVDISGMLAAAGIASVIIAFAIQDALKDIIRGFDIISDNYYNVGDIVKIGTIEGKVLAVGLKTTRIHDIATGNLVSIANRNIVEAEVMSGMIAVNVPFSYEVSLDRAEKVMHEITEKIEQLPEITKAEYRKITNFSESSMDHCVLVTGNPELRFQNRRDCLEIVAKTLAAHKISVPYPHLELKQSKS